MNDSITREYRAQYGSKFRDEFDGYMTQVYNYFALPPAQDDFCDTALQVATASAGVPSTELESFALANLPVLDGVFDNFYTRYEQYQIDVAAWDAEYAPPPPVSGFAPSAAGVGNGSVIGVDVAPSSGSCRQQCRLPAIRAVQ